MDSAPKKNSFSNNDQEKDIHNVVMKDRQKGNILRENVKLQDVTDIDIADMVKDSDLHIQKLKLEQANLERSRRTINNEMTRNFVTNGVTVTGISVKEGQKLTGVELSPALFRKTGLLKVIADLGWNINDLGDITISDLTDKIINCKNDELKYKHQVENSDVIGPMCHELSDIVTKVAERCDFNLILGGDQCLATGSISGMLRRYPDLKVVWFGAHADINTPETSPSGNYHGMPVAHLLGWIGKGDVKGFNWLYDGPLLKPENIVYIGLRDVDP